MLIMNNSSLLLEKHRVIGIESSRVEQSKAEESRVE
jgi:hypothetical protein